MTDEVDWEQYVAVASSHVWAFKLGGTPPEASAAAQAPPAPGQAPPLALTGPLTDATLIEPTSLARDMGLTGTRHMVDEYAFSPARARVRVGTPVTWLNNGTIGHTVVALDGSWTTGALLPIQAEVVTFDRPGTYLYTGKEHPWVLAELTVVDSVE
jgi:plastocyanin